MAKQKQGFEVFLSEFSRKGQVPTWEDCGNVQKAYRGKTGIKSGREAGSYVEVGKAIKIWRASASLIIERVGIGILARRIDALEAEVKSLREAVSSPKSIIVPIETMEPYPFDVVKLFHVVVEPIDGEFEASLYDANIGASGDTESEAVENLKDIIVNLFERYSKEGSTKLGPGPTKQWAILKGLLKKRA